MSSSRRPSSMADGGPRRLSVQGRASERPGWVELRHRRHEAGARCQGIRDPADVRVCRLWNGCKALHEFVYVVDRATGSSIATAWLITAAYYRFVKGAFRRKGAGGSAGATTYPDPVDHCRVCVWYPTCITRRRTDDHLSIVAGMRRVDTNGSWPTTSSRSVTGGPARRTRNVPDMRSPALSKLRNQARLQLVERDTGTRVFELIEPQPTILAVASPRCRSQVHSTSSSTWRRIHGRSTTGSNT